MSFMVMNNNDLRRIILSYFRKEARVVCSSCKKVCIWDKKIIRKFTQIPIRNHFIVNNLCLECYWRSQTLEIYKSRKGLL